MSHRIDFSGRSERADYLKLAEKADAIVARIQAAGRLGNVFRYKEEADHWRRKAAAVKVNS